MNSPNFDPAPSDMPKQLNLLKSVKLQSGPYCAYYFNGITYVGLERSVCKIDRNFKTVGDFTTPNQCVFAITFHKENVYILIDGVTMEIQKLNHSGDFIRGWPHQDCPDVNCNFTIIEDKLIVPDRRNKLLSVYSLSVEEINDVPCSKLSEDDVSLCAAEDNSVVVSDHGSSTVSRIDISSGYVHWSIPTVRQPQGITMYRETSVVVFSKKSCSLRFLDINTG